jgi:hypothetical protein
MPPSLRFNGYVRRAKAGSVRGACVSLIRFARDRQDATSNFIIDERTEIVLMLRQPGGNRRRSAWA